MPFKIHTVHQLCLNQGKENLFQCSNSNSLVKECVYSIQDHLMVVTGTKHHVKFQ